ncbi:hypothetical protein MTR67_014859 [Solanum verrucosum]|uniref:WRKY domain-containing protein n=1 Tax=Solanum verrucosum TaxID=315347 RepID=A0AAF0TJM1_SOLVR|nr:WRKY transcription factor 72A [Solanum verrucosum]WMV21474.1 hypothetical protein MTR67_014859 [Solanum verrucosum]
MHMEAVFRKSIHGGVVKQDIKIKAGEEGFVEDINDLKVGKERKSVHNEEDNSNSSQQKDLTGDKEDDQLESAKADMEEVMEENQRLKKHLDRIMKDYRNLQMQFHEVAQRDAEKPNNVKHDEAEFVSLSLGRTSSDTKKELSKLILSKKENDEKEEDNLTLALDCKFQSSTKSSPSNLSPENSLGEVKDDEKGADQTWPPHKVLKTMRNEEEDMVQQNPTKRAKVSVRVRCDTPTMNDGCQWRKYGQKIAKGNPCPRAYYRCTVAPNCPVRKQVQRCIQDMSILITTYEGTHNHPLPHSATSMAFTTSAAASMLLSGSSSSGSGPTTSATTTALNYYLSDNSKPNPFYNLPNSSISSSSHSQYPTITLDLTSNSSPSSFPGQHHRTIANSNNYHSRYNNNNNNSSTNILNFSSFESNHLLPMSWNNGNNQTYHKNQDIHYQSYLQNNIKSATSAQTLLPQDTIAAATKAITSDPKFQSALAVALTSIIGSRGGNHHIDEKSGQNLKVTEPFPVLCSFPSISPGDHKDYTL